MKVIGEAGRDKYICEVSHTEIEKFLNKYYNKLGEVRVGQEIDLGKGYDFYQETKIALQKTEEFINVNKKVIEAIISGISVMNGTAKE